MGARNTSIMIKVLFVIISLFVVGNAYPWCMTTLTGGNAAGEAPADACDTQTTPNDMETYATDSQNVCEASGNKFVSSAFIAGESVDICQICVYLKSSSGNSPTYTMTAYLYDDDEGVPGSLVADGTFTGRNMTGMLTGSFQWICFSGASPAVTATNTYHIVLGCNAVDGTNIAYWGADARCATSQWYRGATAPPTTSYETETCGMAKLYK